MHWFWRAIASIIVGFIFLFFYGMIPLHNSLAQNLVDALETFLGEVVAGFVALVPPLVVVAVTFRLLSGYCRRPVADHETRCRKCGYDLTGNVSGVCPECGERI